MDWKKPSVYLLAETKILEEGRNLYFKHLGVEFWGTDAVSDAGELTEIAGKTCYMSFAKRLNSNLSKIRVRSNEDYIQKGLIKTGHESVLEHSSVTFAFCDVSRVLTHELVRHRAGTAFSQVSGRYVRIDNLECYQPGNIPDGELVKLKDALSKIEILYSGIEKSVMQSVGDDFDAKKKATSTLRRMLPQGQTSTIIFTANHRALRHIIKLRTSKHAEEEIKGVFEKVLEMLLERYPHIYKDMEGETHGR